MKCKHKWHLLGPALEYLRMGGGWSQATTSDTKIEFMCEKCGRIKIVIKKILEVVEGSTAG